MFTEAKDGGGGGDNWTVGAVSRAKLQSNHHHQQTIHGLYRTLYKIIILFSMTLYHHYMTIFYFFRFLCIHHVVVVITLLFLLLLEQPWLIVKMTDLHLVKLSLTLAGTHMSYWLWQEGHPAKIAHLHQ